MFSRIQVSLDTSEFAELALPVAIELAQRSGATLDLVGVHDPVAGLDVAEWESAAATWMEEDLKRVSDRVARESGRPVEMHVDHGPIVPTLLARVKASNADLMVTATHGRGLISRAWLGSIADGLIRHAQIPLLLVRPDEDGNPPPTMLQRVMVPLDGSELSLKVLPLAVRVANGFEGRIRLVRIMTIPQDIPTPYTPTVVRMDPSVVEESEAAAARWLEGQAAPLRAEGLEVDTEVRTASSPASAICDAAREWGADLIVMATHGRTGIERAFLGSTADKVVRSTRTPVMISNPEGSA